jgi:hypothetical protein
MHTPIKLHKAHIPWSLFYSREDGRILLLFYARIWIKIKQSRVGVGCILRAAVRLAAGCKFRTPANTFELTEGLSFNYWKFKTGATVSFSLIRPKKLRAK